MQGITANLLQVRVDRPVAQNEIGYVQVQDAEQGAIELMGEVIKYGDGLASVQVFDSTRGIEVGTSVRFSASMLLEVTLGPGMLSKEYDGLQNDLRGIDGVFLHRGARSRALDPDAEWSVKPLVANGDAVFAGDWLGESEENKLPHRVLAPLDLEGKWTVRSIKEEGRYKASDTFAVLQNGEGQQKEVSMIQRWPVKLPVKAHVDKPRPHRLLETGVRTMDALHPMLEGGTGFIPGPFGSGKTVLQHAISKQADADIVIVAACGERANEVVEIFKEFPELDDPRTGRKLMERTIIIANTSNMPVAAREASVYTAMTIGEYYRQMGLRVLLLADSTSRWAQALREMSNRLEDLPGPDAFPMDLSATIANFYARAGTVELRNGQRGAITFIGTVSPAGGNLKEPVTEATKKATRCFYALSQARADGKRYPAVDPIQSYSKYLEYPEFLAYAEEHLSDRYAEQAGEMKNVLLRGSEARDQINILGDDGVPLDYHVRFWRAELLDFAILQQDAFDAVDQMTPMQRQLDQVATVLDICERDFEFSGFEAVADFYKRLINVFKQWNYAPLDSDDFARHRDRIAEMLNEQPQVESESPESASDTSGQKTETATVN
jgi:V/A-type H+-transporting ATPase subunit A